MRRLFLMKGERQMSLFTIADTHLSLAGDKPMDVFSGWSNYVERLEKNWRAVVGEDDTVVMPGDISWELKLDSAAADFGFINSLPGKKLIIKGNHDLWWSTVKKMRAFTEKHGFDTIDFINNSAVRVDNICVCGTRGWLIEESGTDSKLINREALRLRASLEAGRQLGGEPVVFLHYPPITQQNRCEELISVIREFGCRRVYYGHIHGSSGVAWAINGEVDGVTYRLVSCDSVGFTPVLVQQS